MPARDWAFITLQTFRIPKVLCREKDSTFGLVQAVSFQRISIDMKFSQVCPNMKASLHIMQTVRLFEVSCRQLRLHIHSTDMKGLVGTVQTLG